MEHACARYPCHTSVRHMFANVCKPKTVWSRRLASRTDESVLVMSELKCTIMQEDITRNVPCELFSCWETMDSRDLLPPLDDVDLPSLYERPNLQQNKLKNIVQIQNRPHFFNTTRNSKLLKLFVRGICHDFINAISNKEKLSRTIEVRLFMPQSCIGLA